MTATGIERPLAGIAHGSIDAVAGPLAPWRIEPLWESDVAAAGPTTRGGRLPAGLRDRFPSDLAFRLRPERPTIAANFVSTLDGVVALDREGLTGGREISGDSAPDRFLMGLLRASADAVLVGAGTFRASHGHSWTPARAYPAAAEAYGQWRAALGLAGQPSTVVVTASGDLGPHEPIVRGDQPVIVATTEDGAGRLQGRQRDGLDLEVVSDGPRVLVDGLLRLLRARGFGLVVSEAGPNVFAQLLAAGAVDEVFLTVAPQLVGRDPDVARLGLVEGTAFSPGLAPWARLLAVRRSGDHLFLRYDLRRDAGDQERSRD